MNAKRNGERREWMSTVRCPECRLINAKNTRRCRRCGTPLSSGTKRDSVNSGFLNFNRVLRHWVILLIAVVSLACIYGFYRHSKEISASGAEVVGTDKRIEKSTPAKRETEEVKKLGRDFMASLDRNMADQEGKGFDKNQRLALETRTLLQEQQKKITNPSAQKHLSEFYRLVEKYHDQLVRYNSESSHLQDAGQRSGRTRFGIMGDSSLSPDNTASGQADHGNESAGKARSATVSAGDIDETVKALRNLLSAGDYI